MTNREKLLRRVGLKCGDFARQLSYHRVLKEQHKKLNFWICMYNNAIDLAVLDWFHLFGHQNDDLHWKKVISDVKEFRSSLLTCLGLEEEEWKKYREKVKEYRDKDIAHIEVRPVSNVPKMDIALKAADFYYRHTLKELKSYSNYSKWPVDLIAYYEKSLKQSKSIVAFACKATIHLKEEVY